MCVYPCVCVREREWVFAWGLPDLVKAIFFLIDDLFLNCFHQLPTTTAAAAAVVVDGILINEDEGEDDDEADEDAFVVDVCCFYAPCTLHFIMAKCCSGGCLLFFATHPFPLHFQLPIILISNEKGEGKGSGEM